MYSLLVEVLNNAMLVAEGETAETGMICGSEKVAYTNSFGNFATQVLRRMSKIPISTKERPELHKFKALGPQGTKFPPCW